MSTNRPYVSVLIPMYNRERFIIQAINSVLNQKFQDFEIIIVDDGSQDRSVELAKSFEDKRIVIIENSTNLGIPKTRNIGINHARGKYIALLDSDDEMKPSRLKYQVRFLEHHNDYVGCGSWSNTIGSDGQILRHVRVRPITHESIKASFLFHCCIHNRTFMGRTDVMRSLQYNEDFEVGEDYELFLRLLDHGKLYNLPRILVSAREHKDKITRHKIDLNNQKKIHLAKLLLNKLGVEYADDDLYYHIKIARLRGVSSHDLEEEFFYWCELWLDRILTANKETNYFNQKKLNKVISKMWINIVFKFMKEKNDIDFSRIFSSPMNKLFISQLVH